MIYPDLLLLILEFRRYYSIKNDLIQERVVHNFFKTPHS
jgi:hypothetical protein